MDGKILCEQFVSKFYQLFDTNRGECAAQFFANESTYQFEGQTWSGLADITSKLSTLQFPANAQRIISTKDFQQSSLGMNAVIIFVTGKLSGQLFQESFQLVPKQDMRNGLGFYVHNCAFRVSQQNGFNAQSESLNQVSKMFLEHFFGAYDGNRVGLQALYKEDQSSRLCHEGNEFMGRAKIMEKLQSLPQVMHNGASFTVDVQAVNPNDATSVMFAMITGQVVIDESQIQEIKAQKLQIPNANQIKFAQFFQLMKDAASGSYFIGNQIFRLNYS